MATIKEAGADTAIKPIERKHSGAPGSSSMSVFPRGFFSGPILLVPFDKGIQRGKDAPHVHQVGLGLDAASPVVFAKILPEELIDMASQEDVDGWIKYLFSFCQPSRRPASSSC
jgi:hypothetical protein